MPTPEEARLILLGRVLRLGDEIMSLDEAIAGAPKGTFTARERGEVQLALDAAWSAIANARPRFDLTGEPLDPDRMTALSLALREWRKQRATR